jgi:peptide methionine sulfoxide reductase MsrA|tara:strand:+ start:1552 stop:1767 length:216 start_codon:yes stop_codon:yes gene_type:complete
MVKECSGHSIKIRTEFTETLRKADAERKHQKYLDQKKREEEESLARNLKNAERMAKKDAIKADFGKKKMLR